MTDYKQDLKEGIKNSYPIVTSKLLNYTYKQVLFYWITNNDPANLDDNQLLKQAVEFINETESEEFSSVRLLLQFYNEAIEGSLDEFQINTIWAAIHFALSQSFETMDKPTHFVQGPRVKFGKLQEGKIVHFCTENANQKIMKIKKVDPTPTIITRSVTRSITESEWKQFEDTNILIMSTKLPYQLKGGESINLDDIWIPTDVLSASIQSNIHENDILSEHVELGRVVSEYFQDLGISEDISNANKRIDVLQREASEIKELLFQKIHELGLENQARTEDLEEKMRNELKAGLQNTKTELETQMRDLRLTISSDEPQSDDNKEEIENLRTIIKAMQTEIQALLIQDQGFGVDDLLAAKDEKINELRRLIGDIEDQVSTQLTDSQQALAIATSNQQKIRVLQAADEANRFGAEDSEGLQEQLNILKRTINDIAKDNEQTDQILLDKVIFPLQSKVQECEVQIERINTAITDVTNAIKNELEKVRHENEIDNQLSAIERLIENAEDKTKNIEERVGIIRQDVLEKVKVMDSRLDQIENQVNTNTDKIRQIEQILIPSIQNSLDAIAGESGKTDLVSFAEEIRREIKILKDQIQAAGLTAETVSAVLNTSNSVIELEENSRALATNSKNLLEMASIVNDQGLLDGMQLLSQCNGFLRLFKSDMVESDNYTFKQDSLSHKLSQHVEIKALRDDERYDDLVKAWY